MVWIARACVRDCGRALLLHAYVWHLCMCAGVRASGRWEARRPGGVGHEGAHYSPRDSPSIAIYRSAETDCNDLARKTREGAAAAPPQIPGGAAPAPAHPKPTRPTTPPAVQSLPVKSQVDRWRRGWASISTAWPRVCVRARLPVFAAAPVSAPIRARVLRACALQSTMDLFRSPPNSEFFHSLLHINFWTYAWNIKYR